MAVGCQTLAVAWRQHHTATSNTPPAPPGEQRYRWRFIVWYLVIMTTRPTSHISPWLSDQLNPGSIQPLLPFSALRTAQSHKPSLSNQVPIHSWIERVHMRVKCLAQRHDATTPQLRIVPGTSRSKVDRSNHCATMPHTSPNKCYSLTVICLAML